jgi:hypothetical protein
MNYGTMTYRNIVADDGFCFIISTMYDSIVLDIDFITDLNGVDIAANDCIKPDATIIADGNFADNSGIRCDKTIFSPSWSEISTRYDIGHFLKFCYKLNILIERYSMVNRLDNR